MRRVRIIFGLVIAACAFGVAALPALAAPEFTSSGGPISGKAVSEQTFDLGPFKIVCPRAHVTGGTSTPLASETLFISTKYQLCTTRANLGENAIELKTHFATPINFEYRADKAIEEIGSESEETSPGVLKVSGGKIVLNILSLKCVINIEEQSVPFVIGKKTVFEDVSFENEPIIKGIKEFPAIVINNELKRLHFDYEGGQCEEFKKTEEELIDGKYTGELQVGVPKGALTFVE